MEIDKSKISQAWLAASADLGVKVIAHFSIRLAEGEECEFIALVENFGSPKGTLLCLPDEWDDLDYASVAEKHGYYSSGLYKTYEQYNREKFIETLIDWGWFGDKGDQPSWLKK